MSFIFLCVKQFICEITQKRILCKECRYIPFGVQNMRKVYRLFERFVEFFMGKGFKNRSRKGVKRGDFLFKGYFHPFSRVNLATRMACNRFK